MIKETLSVLTGGDSIREMAAELGISETEMRGRLDILISMGYVMARAQPEHSSSACRFCPSTKSCGSCSSKERAYSLTKKGKRIAGL
jgi:DNA-binding transcriptional MocR family regulator